MSVRLAVWLWAPLAASAVFAAVAPLVARRLPPRTATWLLTGGSTVLAAAAVTLPALVLLTLAGQWAPLASLGHWSGRLLAVRQPAGPDAWAVAAAVLGGQALFVVTALWRRGVPLVRTWGAARNVPGPLVVVPDPHPAAFALPGWPGRIVATRGLLEVLDPAERRAVLAHEQAHLDARHDLHLVVVTLAAAAHPLLLGMPAAVRLASERWADERAATATGDRQLVARTIVRVASCRQPRPGPHGAMAATGADVVARVRALVGPPVTRRPALAAALAAAALVPALSAVVAAAQTDAAFQRAELAVAAPARLAATASLGASDVPESPPAPGPTALSTTIPGATVPGPTALPATALPTAR